MAGVSNFCLSPLLLFVFWKNHHREDLHLFFFFPAAPLPPPVVTGLEHPTLLLYPLLAVSLVLLFSSLSLALVVFLRSPKTQAANSRSKEANRGQECTVQLCQEVSPSGQRSEGSHELTVRPRLPVRE